MSAIQAFRRVVTVDWAKQRDVDAKATLLRVAREGHADIMRRQGNPQFDVYANRPGNTNIDSVVLPGPIVYTYTNLRQIVDYALEELRKASPFVSGDYVNGHRLFVNLAPVDALPSDLKPSDEIMITNTVPYARRLEVGKTKTGRPFLIQKPNHIYERVAKDKLIPRYKNVARITFSYATLPSPAVFQRDNKQRSWLTNKNRWYVRSAGKAKDRLAGMAVRTPCIVIAPLV